MSERPGNGRPIQFVHYNCGHSSPVRGTGATVDRPCQTCATTGARSTGLGMIRLAQILGRRPGAHAFSYDHIRDCEMCATCIP